MTQRSMDEEWLSSQLSGANSDYLESLYEDYLQDPQRVETTWRDYFARLTQGVNTGEALHSKIRQAFIDQAQQPRIATTATAVGGDRDASKLVAVMDLIYAYRHVGHKQAQVDPLNLLQRPVDPDLTLAHHGLSEADLDTEFSIPDFSDKPIKLREIIARLQSIYCGHIGVEYMHITNIEERMWIRRRLEEMRDQVRFDKAKKSWILQRLVAADGLEKYLGMKYVGQKRFSLEGGDSLIPMMDELVYRAGEQGVKEIVVGMAHRGRLNVLVNVLGKSPEQLFSEFEGKHSKKLLSGDVKYHNGFSSDIQTSGGMVHLAMAFNPSHLEIVAPVVEGSVRARQHRRQDLDRKQVLPIQLHGDAAFAAQGVVMETLQMSQTRGYRTGGSVHIVINNQVGFTTSQPLDARSTFYCTDIVKMIEVPVFHINGDDPEAVVKATQLALDYRMAFKKDVVLDLVCYRRHGHNEADEPFGTQPLMYKAIKDHKVPAALYSEQLVNENSVTQAEYEEMLSAYRAALESGKPVAKIIDPALNTKFVVDWSPYMGAHWDIAHSTAIPKDKLVQIARTLEKLPDGFEMQRQVAKTYEDRAKMTAGELPANWGYAEVLAYATLVNEGQFVRVSGEDVGRGTFSHRHAVLHDQKTGEVYIPLKHVSEKQGSFKIIDSLLSEEAVLAFEYGFASSAPEGLVIWEAQFGDFVNVAQVVIDQFISSAEEKWGRMCGLAMFLPHGFEGQGAEHSSARLERFLQLCAHDNMQVCVPTTPAQIYHLIRRQVLRPFRKPLIVMTPKSLLRHPLVTSTLDELANGKFQNVITEIDAIPTDKTERVVLCSGKVYYDLLAKRRQDKIDNIAIIRLEQLYPFPVEELQAALAPYSKVNDIVWCQEEPENQGAWRMIQHEIRKILSAKQILNYAGRESFAAPAVGYPALHQEQQAALVNASLTLKK